MREKKKIPLVIGHRGAYDEAPENTLKGFKKAIDLGADYIEFDVHESKDGALVVIHGVDILRRMGIESTIAQMTLKELKNIKFEEGESIPEFKEVVKLAKGRINFLCEIKARGISEKVVNLLKEAKMLDSTIFQSFHIDYLLSVRKIDPNISLGCIVPITEEFIPEWDKRKELIKNVVALDFPYIVTRYKNVDLEFVKFAHNHNLQVLAYPINTKKTMRRCIDLGVDGLIVNSISKARKVLHQLNLE
jgi:glycerophosphoryl diester phosphodiesterase